MSEPNVWKCAFNGDFERLSELIEQQRDLVSSLDESRRVPLHWAASGGHESCASLLLEYGSPVDTADDSGWTPLVIATSAGRHQIVTLLLDRGADVNHVTSTGQSALFYAASKGHLKIAEALLASGANPLISDNYGATALHRAASVGHVTVVECLLASREPVGSDNTAASTDRLHSLVNAVDVRGNTPLHLACEDEQFAVCRTLVERGADLGALNRAKQSPLDLAPVKLSRALSELAEQSRAH